MQQTILGAPKSKYLAYIKKLSLFLLVVLSVVSVIYGIRLRADYTSIPVISEDSMTLQKQLQYKEVDKSALQSWLDNRNSLLSEDPYFNQIFITAKDFNINPLLLFAITGQEQGFVPRHNSNACEIASNPFNVYGSWRVYNTSIEDSSRIAARTIINLSKGCPDDADPILWLNQSYAEDPNWYKGVSALLNQLEEVALLP